MNDIVKEHEYGDAEFALAKYADDRIDEWYQHSNKKLRKINLRRWNRVLKMLGEEPYPGFKKVKPVTLEVAQRWYNGQADNEYHKVVLYLLDRQKTKSKTRVVLDDGTIQIQGNTVHTNLGFFQDYCDKNEDGILEAMIAKWNKECVYVQNMSKSNFAALHKGRRQTEQECLDSFFKDAPYWLSADTSVAEELEESKDNIVEWEAWEEEQEKKLEE